MKKAAKSRTAGAQTALRGEYRFDYSRAKPNRFADRVRSGAVAVVLDPDVAEVFQSGAAVNEILRSLIRVWPVARRARTAVSPRGQAGKARSRTRTTKR
jgi:hypothetical protein